MDQVTETATATAPPRDSFAHAAAVAAEIVAPLSPPPFSVHIDQDFPQGWRIVATFRSHEAAGLHELAAHLDVPITEATVTDGIRLEVITRLKDIEICGGAVVTREQAALLAGDPARVDETTAPEAPAAADTQPVPLGASVLAAVPAVIPVQPLNTDGLYTEDVARCVRCGCTEDAACGGGCYWVPNQQMVDLCSACATPAELQAMSYTAEISDGGE
ncbi:hypothetical protein [Streptomyces sp. GbtcB6]|uniref:hypothetical protein n=1 Tax=Streptomyces sp. GbtcB6 TaxID=2824751 RepID=UPI001C310192|nr:hypothetical protein [Streptomyces sp. GbtcB6]